MFPLFIAVFPNISGFAELGEGDGSMQVASKHMHAHVTPFARMTGMCVCHSCKWLMRAHPLHNALQLFPQPSCNPLMGHRLGTPDLQSCFFIFSFILPLFL